MFEGAVELNDSYGSVLSGSRCGSISFLTEETSAGEKWGKMHRKQSVWSEQHPWTACEKILRPSVLGSLDMDLSQSGTIIQAQKRIFCARSDDY